MNGHVRTTDPATGRPDHPCLITVSADRTTFIGLDLQYPKLDPKACLRKLSAEISPHPHNLVHIAPIVDVDIAEYRIAHGPEALAKLDHRMDLLAMNPYEFERLVKDLFAKMGYDTWRTESSRDDGIDAVATKSDPDMPVECIVQAKRLKGAVAPKEIQALMGAMTEKPTATHDSLTGPPPARRSHGQLTDPPRRPSARWRRGDRSRHTADVTTPTVLERPVYGMSQAARLLGCAPTHCAAGSTATNAPALPTPQSSAKNAAAATP